MPKVGKSEQVRSLFLEALPRLRKDGSERRDERHRQREQPPENEAVFWSLSICPSMLSNVNRARSYTALMNSASHGESRVVAKSRGFGGRQPRDEALLHHLQAVRL